MAFLSKCEQVEIFFLFGMLNNIKLCIHLPNAHSSDILWQVFIEYHQEICHVIQSFMINKKLKSCLMCRNHCVCPACSQDFKFGFPQYKFQGFFNQPLNSFKSRL